MQEKALVSIIVPVYCVESFLDDCVLSLIKQTYQNIEIVLIDDGSTDSSGAKCDSYALADKRINVIHKTNGGLSDARNYGLRVAKGDYLVFVDSDDCVSPIFIQTLLETSLRFDADIVECGHIKFDNSIPSAVINDSIEQMTPKKWLTETGLKDFISVVVWNKLYKKKIYDGIFFPVGRHYEDESTTYKVVFRSNKIIRLRSKLYFYRQRKGSIVHQIKSMNEINQKYQALLEKCLFFDGVDDEICSHCFAKLCIYMISEYKTIKINGWDYNGWYLKIKEFKNRINHSTSFKYRLYIVCFVIFPWFF